MSFRYFDSPKPRFLGHRGAAGRAPENTLPSLKIATESTSYIETDTWLTRDGVPVLLHDESLLRTCGVDKKIGDLSLAELEAFDAGYTFTTDGGKSFPFRGQGLRIPTLEKALQEFPQHFFNIEIKDSRPEAVSKVLETSATR
jgi:glycerophosphoryl diester phosphodiesterase